MNQQKRLRIEIINYLAEPTNIPSTQNLKKVTKA
jgi:hypothetical protein